MSVWFQNRRQAEKKRSGRYGGSGIAPGATPGTGQSTPALESTPAKPSATVVAQRKPLGNASENAAAAIKRSEPVEISDMSSDNKENIPPWLVARATSSRPPLLEPLKRQTPAKPKDTHTASKAASTPRDLRQDVGPQGMGIAHVEVDAPAPKTMSRHRSTPRLSLDDVLSGRSQTLRRAATERAPLAALTAEDGLDTILPPPKLLSRASSASSLSLLTTSGGRASIGNITAIPAAASPPASQSESLTSSLPPQLTAVLQRQGIIAGVDRAQSHVERSGLLGMMPSSSVSSSEADVGNDAREEEDEERTLKLIAQRRAAKGQEQRADAREAIASVGADAAVGKKVVGLAPARAVSLDWAAGRDRASTSALPVSIGGTPLSRSVSMRLPTASTPLSTRAGGSAPETAADKRKRPTARSLSATDLTRRLQDAKRKTGAAARKKPACVDENTAPTAPMESAKRRRVEEAPAFGSMVSPMLSRSLAYPTRPVGLTATPQYVRAVSTPFARRWDLHTPSRVLGDRTNFTPAPAQAFSHDDSGFFDCHSPPKRDDPNDHQAAELLLGLGKSAVDSRDSSASQ